jgi:uncharacterized protein
MSSIHGIDWIVVTRPTLECNFSCSYCYIAPRNRKMDTRLSVGLFDKFLHALLQTGCGSVSFSWQGGEPTLIGLNHMKSFLERSDEILLKEGIKNYHCIHTNGALIDEDWAKLSADKDISVGVSLDSYQEINDRCRKVYSRNMNSSAYSYALNAIDQLYKCGVTVEVTSTIARPRDVDIERLYIFFRTLPATRLNVEPCLTNSPQNKHTYGNSWLQAYFDCMSQLFQYWIRDDQRPPIQYFHELDNFFTHGIKSTSCHMTGDCWNHIMIQPNDDVFPCDQFGDYKEFMICNAANDLVSKLTSLSTSPLYNRAYEFKSLCEGCSWFSMCNGSCLFQRLSEVTDPDDDYIKQCQRNRFFSIVAKEYE